ncbi:hypothetical protein RhiirB3_453886 [Rhizophagus irregularis]|nr:hypothetical protein RhiirB3_453886 [Rhizophagus irregularis]
MYKEEFLLNDNKYLNICVDKAIFRSYGIFHLATAIGVQFLDKLQAIVDYRSAKRSNSILASFPYRRKNNYTTSVVHFLSIFNKYPNLEKKFKYCASINLARKGHYSAFDETLEMHGVGYIKQNFLDPYNYDKKDHKVNNQIDPLWKLIDNLVEVFQISNYREYKLFKKNPPSQLTPEGLEELNNAYKEGLKRIKEILTKSSQKKKALENTPHSISHEISQQQLSSKNSNRQSNIPEEEKEILNPLLLKSTVLTDRAWTRIRMSQLE